MQIPSCLPKLLPQTPKKKSTKAQQQKKILNYLRYEIQIPKIVPMGNKSTLD